MARKKTCPECAERIQADARVCRHCGHRFEDAPQGGPTEPVFAEEDRRNEGARWAVLTIIVLAGGLAFGYAGRDCEGFKDSSEQVGTLLGSVLGAALIAAIYALIGMLFQRLRRRPVNFIRSLLSFWVIGLLVISILGSTGNAARERDDECANGEPTSASEATTPTPDPLGLKLAARGSDLSPVDKSSLNRAFRLKLRIDKGVQEVIAGYNDTSISADAWLEQADSQIPALQRDVRQQTTAVSQISEEEVRLFMDDLPPILSAQVTGLDDIATAVRIGATQRAVDEAVDAYNKTLKPENDWSRQLRSLVKPYV